MQRVWSGEDLGGNSSGFRRIQSETTVRENMGRTLWWLATETMEKLLGDTDSRRLCAGDRFERPGRT
jgi:hypothetical protein